MTKFAHNNILMQDRHNRSVQTFYMLFSIFTAFSHSSFSCVGKCSIHTTWHSSASPLLNSLSLALFFYLIDHFFTFTFLPYNQLAFSKVLLQTEAYSHQSEGGKNVKFFFSDICLTYSGKNVPPFFS